MLASRFLLACGLCLVSYNLAEASEDLTISPTFLYYLKQSGHTRTVTDDKGSSTVKYNTTSSYGLPGVEVSKRTASHTVTAVAALEASETSLTLYQMYAALSKNGITYKLGFFDPSDVSQGFAYLPLKADPNYFGMMALQDSYMGLNFDEVGLSLIYGNRTVQHRVDINSPPAQATTAATDHTTTGFYYSSDWNWISFSAAAVNARYINDPQKGASKTALAAGNYVDQMRTLGISFHTSLASVALQSEQIKNITVAATDTELRSNINFDFPIGDRAGIGASYTQRSTQDSTAHPTTWTHSELGYAHSFEELQLVLMLFNSLEADKDTSSTTTDKGVTAGMYLEY